MSYSGKTTMRGADAKIRLMKNGQPLDIIAAEEIDLHVLLVVVDSDPLDQPETQRDTYPNGAEVMTRNVRKGNALLDEIAANYKASKEQGIPFPKYTALISFRDKSSNQTKTYKVIDATFTNLDAFASGGRTAKSTEGFTLTGSLA